jgi:hypothetical protein
MPIVDCTVPSMLGRDTNVLGNQDWIQGGLLTNAGVANNAQINNAQITLGNLSSITYQYSTAATAAINCIYYPSIEWPTQSVSYPITYSTPIDWNYWNYQVQYQYQAQYNGNNYYGNYDGTYSLPPETPEQKLAREEQEQRRVVAATRAEELLLLHLSEDQQKQYLEKGYFETIVNDKTYRINKGRAGNVYLIEGGKTKYKYCAHPSAYTPEQDAMLAQLLMLKTDEERFIKTANKTVIYG